MPSFDRSDNLRLSYEFDDFTDPWDERPFFCSSTATAARPHSGIAGCPTCLVGIGSSGPTHGVWESRSETS
ncbi:MAG: hypothetical protein VX079_09165, partial [Pseudomonadota bacterium]|nr:hypothetical protein [Pseudomonadota bacterium]